MTRQKKVAQEIKIPRFYLKLLEYSDLFNLGIQHKSKRLKTGKKGQHESDFEELAIIASPQLQDEILTLVNQPKSVFIYAKQSIESYDQEAVYRLTELGLINKDSYDTHDVLNINQDLIDSLYKKAEQYVGTSNEVLVLSSVNLMEGCREYYLEEAKGKEVNIYKLMLIALMVGNVFTDVVKASMEAEAKAGKARSMGAKDIETRRVEAVKLFYTFKKENCSYSNENIYRKIAGQLTAIKEVGGELNPLTSNTVKGYFMKGKTQTTNNELIQASTELMITLEELKKTLPKSII